MADVAEFWSLIVLEQMADLFDKVVIEQMKLKHDTPILALTY
jgi:hypothetical protein